MLSGFLDSIRRLFDQIRERIQNPFSEDTVTAFAGTFMIAFAIKHWKLVYSLFYFDSSETRADRLRITESFLSQENFTTLVCIPAILAILALCAYYFINNIALALSLLLRDYLKGGILLLFDRRRIRSKEEFDRLSKRLNRTQQNFEKTDVELTELKESFTEASKSLAARTSENSELNSKLSVAERKITSLESELEEMKNDSVSVNTESDDPFFVVLASYGSDDVQADVTLLVRNKLFGDRKVAVTNEQLGGDPIKFTIKDLTVVYFANGQGRTVKAIEGSIIELNDHELHVHATAPANKKQASRNALLSLANDFQGQWYLDYRLPNGKGAIEYVVIDSTGRYFANGKHTFDIRAVTFNENGKASFSKISIGDRERFSTETITRDAKDQWTGKDSRGYKLNYSKIHPTKGNSKSQSDDLRDTVQQ